MEKLYIDEINEIINNDNVRDFKEIKINYPSGKIITQIEITFKNDAIKRIELLHGEKPKPKRPKTLYGKMLEIGIMLEKEPHNKKLEKEYKEMKFKVVEKELQKLFNQ